MKQSKVHIMLANIGRAHTMTQDSCSYLFDMDVWSAQRS